MRKCIVCECAGILYYEPPAERPPVKCPNCGRDTRHYTSLKADDPRVQSLVEKYKERLGKDAAQGQAKDMSERQPGSGVSDEGGLPDVEVNVSSQSEDGTREGELSYTAVNESSLSDGGISEDGLSDAGANERYLSDAEISKDGLSDVERREVGTRAFSLVNIEGGYRIPVPENGGVIGRTAIGGEELAHNGRISREHIKVIPAKRAEGIMIEDVSANGTFIGSRRLTKNKAEFAVIGTVVTMGGETFVVTLDSDDVDG